VGIAIVYSVFVLLLCVFLAVIFVWAARKDGEEDQAVQARLGMRRKTRLGR
jgi:3-deoxy-D-manno-octulosonic-acid transferase